MSTTTTRPGPTGTTAATGAAAGGRSLLLESWPGAIGYVAVAAVLTYFAVASENFATLDNLATIAGQASVYAVAGFGLAVVVIVGGDDVVAGGIDLSVGAVAGFSGAVAAVLLTGGSALSTALVGGLAVALLVGALNAAAVTWGVRPLLATLATGAAASSVTLVITGNAKVVVEQPAVAAFRDGAVLGIPAAVVVLLVVFIGVALLLGRTPWGVGAYAVGQNRTAARVAGLSVGRYVAVSYLVSGLLAGVAGLLFVGRFSAAVPDLGNQVLLDVLLTTFLSVVFSRRTTVTVTGVLVGALFVAALSSGFTQVGVESQWVGAVKGVLIAAVLAVAALRAKGARR